jgi:hypothetical protein
MKQRSELDRSVDRTLESLDGIERASPAPWLFTRVKARLTREDRTTWSMMSTFLSRPAVTIAGLCLILVLNAALLLNKGRSGNTEVPVVHAEQVMESESLIASSSSFDYENLVQP